MIDTIQQSVKQHDTHQVEIKLDYELFATKKTKYHISTYIFVPQSLGITPETYPRHMFYRDAQNYIRLKTPSLNLREFTESERSPLRKIEALVARADWVADPTSHEQIITQLKLLASTFNSALRDHYLFLQQRVAESESAEHAKTHTVIRNLVTEFLDQTRAIVAAFRELYANFHLPNVPERVFTAYSFTDESLSILIEEGAADMFFIADQCFKRRESEQLKELLSSLARNESKHRKARGYKSILKIEGDNEVYLSQASRLKKFASSVLFLNVSIEPEGTFLMQFVFALAAGLSMVFATALAFFFQSRFGNFTLPFFIALVVGYMFKDRIKDLVRLLFAKQLDDRLYDRRVNIRTQDGKHKLGIMKEKVRFIKEKEVPATVRRDRRKTKASNLFEEGQAEQIICYSREITLDCETFAAVFPSFPEITGLNDIWRYDIRHLLNRMADPEQERLLFREGELVPVTGQKVYPVNIISRFRIVLPESSKRNNGLRLILNREGIKRIEEVG